MSEDRQSGASSPADLPEISDDLIRSFKSLYLPSYRPPIYRKLHGSGWQCHHQGWYTEAAHRGHLAQRWINGYPGHSYTKFVAFDLDRHNGEDDWEIYAHADAIAKAVDADLVRVQSSESRGLHLYAFLAEPVWTIRATTHTRDLLKASNVPCPEIYPSGTKNFRVPFGLGSFLLDQTYEPVSYSNVDSFLAFYEKLRREQVDRLTIPAAPKASPDADNLPRRAIGDELSPYMRDVDLLMTGGMQKPETLECLRDDEPEARNKQTWLLCWYLKVIEGRNDAQVINYLNHWIHSKNNGLSGDFDANPAAVYAENKRIVRNFDPLKVGRGTKRSQARQNRLEALRAYTGSLSLSPAQAELWAQILTYSESRGKKKYKYREVEIPQQTFQSWAGVHKAAGVLRSLIRLGYLKISVNHSSDLGKCRTYRLLKLPQMSPIPKTAF